MARPSIAVSGLDDLTVSDPGADEASTYRKVTWRLVPFLMLCYVVAYLDRVNVSVGEMVAALEKVAGAEPVSRITFAPDPAIERIVKSWPGAWDVTRARALGLSADADFETIIRAYMEDELTPAKAAG